MSEQEWYEGRPESHTALILAEIAEGRPPGFTIAHFGRDAYEMYQIASYTKELVRVQADPDYLCWSPGFRTLGRVVIDLVRKHGQIVFEEFGSTLFSSIDKINKVAAEEGADVSGRVAYRGVEILQALCDIARRFHPTELIEHFRTAADLPDSKQIIVSRSYQATSYGLASTRDLASWAGRAAFTIQGVWFSEGAERVTTVLGKKLRLFDFEALRRDLEAQGKQVVVLGAQRRQFNAEIIVDGWLIAFDRSVVDPALVSDSLRRELGIEMDAPESRDLRPSADVVPHAGGLDMSPAEDDPLANSFALGSSGMVEAFRAYAHKLS